MTNLNKKGASGDGVLKVDRKGRVRTPPERREALLDEYEKSGMSGKGFAEHYGINYQTFYSWRCKRRKARGSAKRGKRPASAGAAETPSFTLAVAELPAPEAAPPDGGLLEVALPGGVHLSVTSVAGARLAVELIRLLGKAPARPC